LTCWFVINALATFSMNVIRYCGKHAVRCENKNDYSPNVSSVINIAALFNIHWLKAEVGHVWENDLKLDFRGLGCESVDRFMWPRTSVSGRTLWIR
jgi:hypothetical protein